MDFTGSSKRSGPSDGSEFKRPRLEDAPSMSGGSRSLNVLESQIRAKAEQAATQTPYEKPYVPDSTHFSNEQKIANRNLNESFKELKAAVDRQPGKEKSSDHTAYEGPYDPNSRRISPEEQIANRNLNESFKELKKAVDRETSTSIESMKELEELEKGDKIARNISEKSLNLIVEITRDTDTRNAVNTIRLSRGLIVDAHAKSYVIGSLSGKQILDAENRVKPEKLAYAGIQLKKAYADIKPSTRTHRMQSIHDEIALILGNTM